MTVTQGGKRKEKILFLEYPKVSDGAGGFLDAVETDVLETWASVKQIKASRVAENFQEAINAVYEFKVLKRAGFSPKSDYTLRWDSKDHEIVSITEDVETKREWVIIGVSRGKGL